MSTIISGRAARLAVLALGFTTLGACHRASNDETQRQPLVSPSAIAESIEVVAEPGLTKAERAVVQDATRKVLVHVSRAREALDANQTAAATENLQQALRLVRIVKGTLPVTEIRQRISSARARLSYEDTEVLTQDLVPILSELDVLERLVPTKAGRRHVQRAREQLRRRHRKAAEQELKAIDEGEQLAEIDLDLAGSERRLQAALEALKRGDPKKARQLMRPSELLTSLEIRPIDNHGAKEVDISVGLMGIQGAEHPAGKPGKKHHHG